MPYHSLQVRIFFQLLVGSVCTFQYSIYVLSRSLLNAVILLVVSLLIVYSCIVITSHYMCIHKCIMHIKYINVGHGINVSYKA